MITVAGSLWGIIEYYSTIYAIKFLEQYVEFINILKTEIRYNKYPINEIINLYSKRYSNIKDNWFCIYLSDCLKHIKDGHAFYKAWELTFNNIHKNISLSKTQENLITSFGIGLGNSDISGQLSHCEYHINTMGEQIKSLTETNKSKGKLKIVLGTCMGMLIALLLI